MENFYSLLCVMGMATWSPDIDNSVDFMKSLPPEIAILILRNLDGKSLFAACRVSRTWWRLCRADGQLRAKIAAHLRVERRRRESRIRGEDIVVLRNMQQAQADIFKPRNGKYAVVRRDREISHPYALPSSTNVHRKRATEKKSKKSSRQSIKPLRL